MDKVFMRLSSFARSLNRSTAATHSIAMLSVFVMLAAITVPNLRAQDAASGEKTFKQSCATCHTIGGGKITGPDLKDVHKRVPSEAWMIPWIRNSMEVIKGGDEYANKIFRDFNSVQMTANPLSDEEIKSVIEYIKVESAREPVAVEGQAENPYITGNVIPPDHSELYGLLAVAALLVVLFFILGTVRISLRKLNAELRGGDPPVDNTVMESVKRWMRTHKRWVALCMLIAFAIMARAAWFGMLYVNVEQGYEPEQPIWFSHKVHAGTNAINCVYCHSGAEKSKTAGIPSANVCMNCHRAIKKGTFTGDKEIPKIFAALDYDPEKDKYGDNPKPVKWVRIHNLPDLAYFNHSQHVAVGKIACQTCHGPVQEMHVMRQESMLTMGWCINCHRTTEVKMKGNAYYDELHKNLAEKYPGEKITVDKMGGIDCARCHY